jgi:CheY-like chemotaxis protein
MSTARLPLLTDESDRWGDQENSQALVNPQALPLRNLRVLLVDDDADTQQLVTFALEEAGAEVTALASAIEALRVFEQIKPDLLVSDIGMPDMDGYSLMQQIRALPPERGGEIPAIALTAYAGEVNCQQAIAAGFQMHVPKPIDLDELAQTVAELLGRK